MPILIIWDGLMKLRCNVSRALFQSQEAFEDDPYIGKDVFQQVKTHL